MDYDRVEIRTRNENNVKIVGSYSDDIVKVEIYGDVGIMSALLEEYDLI